MKSLAGPASARPACARSALVLSVALAATGCTLPGQHTQAPPPVPAGARFGGTLAVGITTPAGIAPLDAYEPAGQLVSSLLCDTLVTLDPATGEPTPGLLRAWQVAGSTITLELRHGIRMSNGQVLTAQDVAYSLSQLANPINASREAGLLSEVAGYQQLSQNLFAKPTDMLAGINVINAHDLQVTLTVKDPGFLYALAEPATAPVSESAERAHPSTFGADPVCAGPYKLDQPYRPGAATLLLDRVPGYYDRNAGYTGGGRGYPDHVLFKVYPSTNAAYRAFRAGEVDLAKVPADRSGIAAPKGAAVVTGSEPVEEFVGLPDGLDNALAGSAVHRALSESLDRMAIIGAVWQGVAAPATGFLPPGLGESASGTSCGSTSPASGDLAGARALLTPAERAALAHTTSTFYVNSDYANLAEAQAVARQWQAAFGLHITVKALPWADYLQRATVGAGFDGLFRLDWAARSATPVATGADPVQFLSELFLSSNTQTANWAHYQDQRFDVSLTQDAQPAALGLVRRDQVQALSSYLCTQMPIIPLAFGEVQWLVRTSTLASARPSYLSVAGIPLLREMYLK
ncbi:MAG: ABC transporter substrate-binding protein [Mycobacteriales bacterium]